MGSDLVVAAGWADLVKPSLLGLDPYRPGESVQELRERHGLEEVVKLNWNEGLFGPFPGVLEAAAAELENAWMYPERAYNDLREAVAGWLELPPERIVPGHGIQSLVTTLAAAAVLPGDDVVLPRPTYGLYAQVLAAAGARLELVPVRGDDLALDLDRMAAAARRARAKLVVVCDPNNPTGLQLTRAEWDEFVSALPEGCIAVVDEAYVEYVDPAARLGRERDASDGRPVILLRTFSKIFGLAGLRLGYAIVHEELEPYLDVVQEPFNVNRVALAAGKASLARADLVEERRRQAVEARELLASRLAELGARVVPSQANFVLAEVPVDDAVLADRLAARGFLIRPGSEFGLPGYIRVTAAPIPVVERFAAVLADELGG
ncbi:MAG TPA: histidinol-phosphate transaminase [Gaiellaceae bacterium]|nr:histidinol-phosphate transaminase [Gaiellaceae bacterium]